MAAVSGSGLDPSSSSTSKIFDFVCVSHSELNQLADHAPSSQNGAITPPPANHPAKKRMRIVSSPGLPDVKDNPKNKRRCRNGVHSQKTAEVWRFFVPIPTECAATCMICSKVIKATNGSTTGMIRHLKGCHRDEYQILQTAMQQNMIRKIEAKVGTRRTQHGGDSESDSTALPDDVNRISGKMDSGEASTSVISEDDHGKLNSMERPVSTPVSSTTPESASIDVVEVKKKPEQPLPTKSDPISDINAQIAFLIVLGVLNVEVVDNPLFRNFLSFLSPDANLNLASAEEFRAQILPALNSCGFGAQTVAANNAHQTHTCADDTCSVSPVSSTESGFYDDELRHSSTDFSSSVNDLPVETDFNKLLDYIGHGIFPMDALQNLMTRCQRAYNAMKDSEFVRSKLFELLDTDCKTDNIDVYLGDLNGIGDLLRLWKPLCFGVKCSKAINTLIQNGILTGISLFDPEDLELLTAVHHHITSLYN